MWFPKILEKFEIIKKFYFRSGDFTFSLNWTQFSFDPISRVQQYDSYFMSHKVWVIWQDQIVQSGCINPSNTSDKIRKASTESDISVIRTRVPAQDPIWLPKRHKTSLKVLLYGQKLG